MSNPAFQQYQAEFTSHIRVPSSVKPPKGSSARGMRVYADIVFNNMNETLSACFPVCKKILGARRWKKLVRSFIAEHRCSTPWFRQIPEELLHWLETSPDAALDLPPFIPGLAHYEWMELAIAISDAAATAAPDPDINLLTSRPSLAPALALLDYDWPVHRISPRSKPGHPSPVSLLVFRDTTDNVRFIELNPVSARLVRLLQKGQCTGQQALEQIAREIQHAEPQAVVRFGAEVLEELRRQGAIG